MRCTIVLLSCLLCMSCSFTEFGKEGSSTCTVMTWNVQNLMDAVVDGTEYDEYLPKGGWTDAAYRARLKRAVQVILDPAHPLADILVLQEVEHARVVADLLEGKLLRKGYAWYACTDTPGSAIQIAIVSRYPIEQASVHAVPDGRPVLSCTIVVAGQRLVVMGVHGKSRLEGDMETEAQRIALSRTIGLVSDSVLAEDPNALVVVAGDFNGSADEQQSWQTAFVQEHDPRSTVFARQGSLVVTGRRGGDQVWYVPWLDQSLTFSRSGSCYFSGAWQRYDQVLANGALFDGKGWDFARSGVSTPSSMVATDGKPLAWNVRAKSGVSDHFPFWMELRLQFESQGKEQTPAPSLL